MMMIIFREIEAKEVPKLRLREVMSAMLDVVERGGREVNII